MGRSLIQGGPTKLFVSHSVIEVKKVRLSWTGLYGSRRLRLLEFLDSRAYEGGERVSAVRTRQTDGHNEANKLEIGPLKPGSPPLLRGATRKFL
jgi:hypothetical protein